MTAVEMLLKAIPKLKFFLNHCLDKLWIPNFEIKVFISSAAFCCRHAPKFMDSGLDVFPTEAFQLYLK